MRGLRVLLVPADAEHTKGWDYSLHAAASAVTACPSPPASSLSSLSETHVVSSDINESLIDEPPRP
jgi:hypothetical protein